MFPQRCAWGGEGSRPSCHGCLPSMAVGQLEAPRTVQVDHILLSADGVTLFPTVPQQHLLQPGVNQGPVLCSLKKLFLVRLKNMPWGHEGGCHHHPCQRVDWGSWAHPRFWSIFVSPYPLSYNLTNCFTDPMAILVTF